MTDESGVDTRQIGALLTIIIYPLSLVVGAAAYLNGQELLAVTLIAGSWLLSAFDPDVGRWRHVWN